MAEAGPGITGSLASGPAAGTDTERPRAGTGARGGAETLVRGIIKQLCCREG